MRDLLPRLLLYVYFTERNQNTYTHINFNLAATQIQRVRYFSRTPSAVYGYLFHPLLLPPERNLLSKTLKANKPLKRNTICNQKQPFPTVTLNTISPQKKPCNLRSLLLSSPSLDPNCRDDRGDTALHLAAGNGERGACELLLKHPRIDRTLQDEDGRTEPWLFCFFFSKEEIDPIRG